MSSDVFAVRGQAVVTRKGAARLALGHPWVYKSDVSKLPDAGAGIVEVASDRGQRLGFALFSPQSLITLRLVSRREPVSAELVRSRLAAALERRRRLLPEADAFRWVHGEADLLPSVFIDRYGDAVTLQTLSAGADLWEPCLSEAIVDLAKPRAVVVRDDATARRREGLATHTSVVHGAAPVVASYHEGALRYEVDLVADQKTGGFLDQVGNHLRAAAYGRGRVLDCFTYHGGFALQLATVAEQVTAIDISAAALARARANAQAAGLANLELIEADAFELLPELVRAGTLFDTVVLDPPAFASNRASEEKARRAYKEINLRAMRLLVPGGILISCSCSGRITPVVFDDILGEAARDAHRAVQILERRAAGVDHPVLVNVPETDYLKCRILCVL
jgi:23S rRNA (cytosine1962-C5)-methyltransferase